MNSFAGLFSDETNERTPRLKSVLPKTVKESSFRRNKGLPSAVRDAVVERPQILEGGVISPIANSSLKSSKHSKSSYNYGNRIFDFPSEVKNLDVVLREYDDEYTHTPEAISNSERDLAYTAPPKNKILFKSPLQVPIRRASDGSPLYMTPILKTKLVNIFIVDLCNFLILSLSRSLSRRERRHYFEVKRMKGGKSLLRRD